MVEGWKPCSLLTLTSLLSSLLFKCVSDGLQFDMKLLTLGRKTIWWEEYRMMSQNAVYAHLKKSLSSMLIQNMVTLYFNVM